MKRRKFIGIIGTGALAVAAGSYISLYSFEKSVEKIITENTKSLKVSSKEILSFIKGANESGLWDSYSFGKIELIKWYASLESMKLPLPFSERYNWYKHEIVNHFLFSTSFFYDGMDESKPVHYLRIYDPYANPCCNPFSNLYYPG